MAEDPIGLPDRAGARPMTDPDPLGSDPERRAGRGDHLRARVATSLGVAETRFGHVRGRIAAVDIAACVVERFIAATADRCDPHRHEIVALAHGSRGRYSSTPWCTTHRRTDEEKRTTLMDTMTVTLTIIAVAAAASLVWALVSTRRAMVGRALESTMRLTADDLAVRRAAGAARSRELAQPRAA